LAESYQSVSPTTWEFKLRRGIRFHNGEPFDAESVKFSLERLIDPRLKLRGASAFTSLTHVEIVDPLTVRVHSKAGWPLLPAVLPVGQAAMLPPRYYREKEMPYLQKNPVGSGPFKLVRWVKDDRIELGLDAEEERERANEQQGEGDKRARYQREGSSKRTTRPAARGCVDLRVPLSSCRRAFCPGRSSLPSSCCR
jgi:hypothetical protein